MHSSDRGSIGRESKKNRMYESGKGYTYSDKYENNGLCILQEKESFKKERKR